MINIYELLRRNQDGTAEYVKNILDELKIPYFVDPYGNIYNLDNENVPLLSAHMDTVRKSSDFCIGAFLTEEEDAEEIFSGGILGGDDKCGVYLILKVLESGRKANFIFSRDEEIGCLGIKALLRPNWKENTELTDKIKNNCLYCLVLDRKGNSDIICYNNNYGTIEFENALEKISNEGKFGYKGATGLCSDANTIRDFISTANLSVGYFNPHSAKEYIIKNDLKKAYDYVLAIIDNLDTKFPKLEYSSYSYKNYGYGYPGYLQFYQSESTKFYQNKNKNYDYYDDLYDIWDDDDYGMYGYSAKDKISSYDKNKKCVCSFCGFSENSEKISDFMMPDGTEFKICSFCLDDMETEIKRIHSKEQFTN